MRWLMQLDWQRGNSRAGYAASYDTERQPGLPGWWARSSADAPYGQPRYVATTSINGGMNVGTHSVDAASRWRWMRVALWV